MGSMGDRDWESEGETLEEEREEGDKDEEARGERENGEEEMDEGDWEGETGAGRRFLTERNCAKSARYLIFSLLLVFHVFLMLAGKKDAGVLVPDVVVVLVVVLVVVGLTVLCGLYRLSN